MTRSVAQGLLVAATQLVSAAAFAQAQAGPCRSQQGIVDMAEIISVRQACDKVYPELRAATADAMEALMRAHGPCYEHVDRAGEFRDVISAASAKLEAPIGNDPRSCTTDLPAAASQLLRFLAR